jgi:PhoH-like ATPase
MRAGKKRLFVLDTNVLLHDPSCMFRFKEHDLYIPMMVLEELDAAKTGTSEVAQNARQVSRFLDGLIADGDRSFIESGLELPYPSNGSAGSPSTGRLYLQTEGFDRTVPPGVPGNTPDNDILRTTLALQRDKTEVEVTLVSKDINLRIKARLLNVAAEDYYNDKVLDDVELLYSGSRELSADFWARQQGEMKCWNENERSNYAIPAEAYGPFYPNECIHTAAPESLEMLARERADGYVNLEQAVNYRQSGAAVWGISARNRGQNFALNLLMDPDIEFVSLLGIAGTGKTLLALAAGISQAFESNRYREIIVTRETVSVGEDIGFLPGTEEEKMTPWMGALLDNLEVLAETEEGGDWGHAASVDLLQNRVKIRSLGFMRGRTFTNRFIIIDEAQNLTPKQMRTLITRAGTGSKIVCLGNIGQIDTPYLSETTCGLTYVVDRFRNWRHSGHVTLTRGERSQLADYAAQRL